MLTKHKLSGVFFVVHGIRQQFVTVCALYRTPIICYRMHSVGLLFADLCAVYANEANKTLILPFQQNQVKTYEKSKKSKKAILTNSNEPQRYL
jgi:hypothetical protein